MSETKSDCTECDEKQTLQKTPSRFRLDSEVKEQKVGDIVKSSIEEIKQDLRAQKEKLSNEFYNSNE
tara:strand:- start:2249 stop:2449 length:201 start_codon:yes stop_codon:yes gene_type:complete